MTRGIASTIASRCSFSDVALREWEVWLNCLLFKLDIVGVSLFRHPALMARFTGGDEENNVYNSVYFQGKGVSFMRIFFFFLHKSLSSPFFLVVPSIYPRKKIKREKSKRTFQVKVFRLTRS